MKRNLYKVFLLVLLAPIACSTFSSKKEREEPVASNPKEESDGGFFSFFKRSGSKPDKKLTWKEEMELNQAKLWTELEQVKKALRKHNSKLRVLLRDTPEDFDMELSETSAYTPPSKMILKDDMSKKSTSETVSPEGYIADLGNAKNIYGQGEFGKAFIAFESLNKSYESKMTQGEPELWKARCWVGLKQFERARDILVKFNTNFPHSSFKHESQIDLAKIEVKLGFGEIATKRLQNYIQEDPKGEFVEVAQQMLSNIEETL